MNGEKYKINIEWANETEDKRKQYLEEKHLEGNDISNITKNFF